MVVEWHDRELWQLWQMHSEWVGRTTVGCEEMIGWDLSDVAANEAYLWWFV